MRRSPEERRARDPLLHPQQVSRDAGRRLGAPRAIRRSSPGRCTVIRSPYRRRMDAFDGLLRQALIVLAILAVATTVGTLVALLQAATQIQEQTLTLLPKIVAVSIALALFGGFGLHLCEALFHEAIARLPAIVAGR